MDIDAAQEDEWERRAQQWVTNNRRRYCPEHTTKLKQTTKDKMPPEYLRKIVRDHGDMTSKRFKTERSTVAGALRYTPHAIAKLLENMPMPWEAEREVNVLFHVTGALTLISDTPKVVEPVYYAQWGTMWLRMRREKCDRAHFRRVAMPVFSEDEPPIDYADVLLDMPVPDPVTLDLDEEEDAAIADWLYDPVGPVADKFWRLPMEALFALHRLGRVMLSDKRDPNYFYLFEKQSFFTAKALNMAIPGAPKFEPLHRDEDPDDDWNEFNDLNKTVIRNPITSEYQIAFPHLYNHRPRNVEVAPYHSPQLLFLPVKEPELPTFSFDPTIAPVPHTANIHQEDGGDDEDFVLPPDFEPFLHDTPISGPNTSEALNVYWAPEPFCHRSGEVSRVVDVSLVQSWFREHCPEEYPIKVKGSYQKLLKSWVENELQTKKHGDTPHRKDRRKRLFEALADSKYFQSATIDWLEAGLQLCRQVHNMLTLLLRRRTLVFLHLDYNFNLKPVMALSTKQRKKSRLGPAFQLVRCFMMLIKSIVDCHVKYRLGDIDAYQLADALHYCFTHVGNITGIHRYKYRTMRQVRRCRQLKHVVYYRFNTGPVGRGPGTGFWAPAWRTWVRFLQGITPMIERYEVNMLARHFEGRRIKGTVTRITKQRTEAQFDRELREAITREVADMIPEGIRANKTRQVLQHFSEAWRRWRSNTPWDVPGMSEKIKALITRFVRYKAEWWTTMAHYNRERIKQGRVVDKSVVRKNDGRLTRLKLIDEQQRQQDYLLHGPFVSPDDAKGMVHLLGRWLANRHFQPIPFPPVHYKHGTKLLRLALDNLALDQGDPKARSGAVSRDEKRLIEEAFDKPQETINKIMRILMTLRNFKEVTVQFVDYFTHMVPVYEIDPEEKIADAFLTQYLFFEASQRRLFPNWIKPSDDLPNPARIFNWCTSINNLTDGWETKNGETLVYVQSTLDRLSENVHFSVLKELLGLVVDKHLADYLSARNNVSICYKDMTHSNHLGLLRGLQFAPFLVQFWGLAMDLAVLGLDRAAEIDGNPNHPNDFATFPDIRTETKHPIRLYMRYINEIHVVYRFTHAQSQDLVERYHAKNPDRSHDPVFGYPTKKCWPRDTRMRLLRHDVVLGRAVFWMLQDRLPRSVTTLIWEDSNVSVYSRDNPHLLFSMNGFELCLQPRCRLPPWQTLSENQNVWNLIDNTTKAVTAQAYLQMSPDEVKRFDTRVRLVLMNSGQTPFEKVINKWNKQVLALVVYFREAIDGTADLANVITRGETKIQNRIKVQLNTKTPKRFPPVVFYAPQDLGGLGMYSMGHMLIAQQDLRYGRQLDARAGYFRSGMTHDSDVEIPNILRYVNMWQDEMRESIRAWHEYAALREEAVQQNRRISMEDLAEIIDLGVPRIRTNFQVDKQTLLYDRGWRVRLEFKTYNLLKPQPFWWTDYKRDGKLYALDKYRGDVVQAFGGVGAILQHSIFPATGFTTWEGLCWDKMSRREEAMKNRRITNAQRGGLSKIPNKRFTLWWAPTINREDIYAGFQTQIDLTGINLYGKLPELKIAFVEIFRGHLWQNIHAGLVRDISKGLETCINTLDIDVVTVNQVHARKSYQTLTSAADITIVASNRWSVSKPSLLAETEDAFTHAVTEKYWIDVQLRWGNYDVHDIEKYARGNFCQYTTDTMSSYPSPTGIVVAFDLAYNTFSAYGHWFPKLKPYVTEILGKIQKHNTELYTLRNRIRQKLQLSTSEVTESHLSSQNYSDLFTGKTVWIVDGTCVHRTIAQRTFEGNLSHRTVNGAVMIINPWSGQLYLRVLHSDAWKGQKRLTALAKMKVAEEVNALLRTLTSEDQPKMIVSTQRGTLDTLTSQLSWMTNTVIKGTNMQVPYKSLLSMPKVRELVERASHSEMHLIKLYDDWLDVVSPYTAFHRCVLLLRALHVNYERARSLLRPDPKSEPVTRAHHMWPTLTPDEWVKVEVALKDMILADYGRRNNVDVTKLTPTELRDILLGQEIQNVNIQKEQMDQLDRVAKEAQNAVLNARTTQTVNKYGQAMTVTTTTAHGTKAFTSKTDWRERALATASRDIHSEIHIHPMDVTARATVRFLIPENLVYRVVACSDVRTQIVGLLFGVVEGNTREIRCIVFPPQHGTHDTITFPLVMPKHALLSGLQPVGLVQTQFGNAMQPSAHEFQTTHQFLSANPELEPLMKQDYVLLSINVGQKTCKIVPYRFTHDGLEFAKSIPSSGPTDDTTGAINASMYERPELSLGGRVSGFCLVPDDDMWNYNFAGTAPPTHLEYPLKPAIPKDFYHPVHRVDHFRRFAMTEGDVHVDGDDVGIDSTNQAD
eukprot:PhM_4_TR13843/c0_g1_i1/m.79014/K12856/PRPF8, PRP8; pre-mRNA-processing factor 8